MSDQFSKEVEKLNEAEKEVRRWFKNEGFALLYSPDTFHLYNEAMNMAGGHTIARRYGQSLDIPNISFEKKGSEIKNAIDNRINTHNEFISECEKSIKEICKNREIDLAEVLEAGEDEAKHAAYAAKSMQTAPKASKLIRELEEDLSKLKTNSYSITRTKVTIEELVRVKKNLQDERKFDLTFNELVDLGF